jgi:PBP1b-binding outer membrane lipoprotein LpoB
MKKITLFFVLMIALLSSCADSKTFTDKNGKQFTAEPYGWANVNANKMDTVVYDINVGNVIWDIILIETVVVPVWLTGWEFYEPVRLKNAQGK